MTRILSLDAPRPAPLDARRGARTPDRERPEAARAD